MEITKATKDDLLSIWQLRQEIQKRFHLEGVDQWQFDSPTLKSFLDDIDKGYLYVIKNGLLVIACVAIRMGPDSDYDAIDGAWHTDSPYIAIHRLAIKDGYLNQGLARMLMLKAEAIAKNEKITTIRIDTHAKNVKAQRLFTQLNYVYCGEVTLSIRQGDPKRNAYDKQIEVEK